MTTQPQFIEFLKGLAPEGVLIKQVWVSRRKGIFKVYVEGVL